MKKPLLFVLVCLFMYKAGLAQPAASFKYSAPQNCSVPALVSFTNTSTASQDHPITKKFWNYGDGTVSDGRNDAFPHFYFAAGIYTVTLVVTNDEGADTATQIVRINSLTLTNSTKHIGSNCSKTVEQFSVTVQSAFPDSLSYVWLVSGGTPGYLISSDSSSIIDSFNTPANASVSLKITSQSGNYCSYDTDTSYTTAMPIVPAKGADVLVANRECLNSSDGWTHYYYDNNTPDDDTDDSLVLSLRLFGQDVGTIGDGTFSVTVGATPGAGSNSAVLVTSPALPSDYGFWAMNRYWKVTATRQPAQPVGVRFYYSKQDITDVNTSFNTPTPRRTLDASSLVFYKTIGGNPDPTTNLADADSTILIRYTTNVIGDENDYIDFNLFNSSSLDTHVADFLVASLDGGGGGGIYNYNQVLPVQLTSFTANNNSNKVTLQWTTAQEINVSKYNVQVSADGRTFTSLGTVAAHGNTTPDAYTFSYNETKLAQAYYRLQIVEKNGTVSGSNIVPLSFVRANNIITLYPNPAKNTVQVKAAGFKNKTAIADIYNAAGVKVSTARLSFNGDIATLNTSALNSGHYTVALCDEQSITHVPLVIVK